MGFTEGIRKLSLVWGMVVAKAGQRSMCSLKRNKTYLPRTEGVSWKLEEDKIE